MTLYRGDMRDVLPTLPTEAVQLVLTSPPYNCGWTYATEGNDNLPLAEYQEMLSAFVAGAYGVLRPGGVLAVNLPQTTMVYEDRARKHREKRAYPIASWMALHLAGGPWLPREPIVWLKSKGDVEIRATSTAIGAYSNPWLRPCHEMVLLASKDEYRIPGREARWPGSASEWGGYLEWCKDVWSIRPGQAKAGEPLAFPDELVTRLVKLFSNPGDVVLDPFAGTGQTAKVAQLLSREAWLIEREPSYWPRLEAVLSQQVMFEASA